MEYNSNIIKPAANGRFGASGAVIPQTILYKFARYYPAASVVEAPPAAKPPGRYLQADNSTEALEKKVIKR